MELKDIKFCMGCHRKAQVEALVREKNAEIAQLQASDLAADLAIADKRIRDLQFELEQMVGKREWVKCDERLPGERDVVLTMGVDGKMRVQRLVTMLYDPPEPLFYADGMAPGKHITHWMPLPEPPKEGA